MAASTVMKSGKLWASACVCVLLLTGVDVGQFALARGELIHRYSFNEEAAEDVAGGAVVDSVGEANGVVRGSGASADGQQLTLPGGPRGVAAYVDLPNGMISRLTDATVEVWYTVDRPTNWARVFDFGSMAVDDNVVNGELRAGRDTVGTPKGLDSFFYTPRPFGRFRQGLVRNLQRGSSVSRL